MPRPRYLYAGTVTGVFFATALSAIALASYVLSDGRALSHPGDPSLLVVVAGYFAGGLAGGLLGGVLAPHVRTEEGAVLVGMVVAVPFLTMFLVALQGWAELRENWYVIAILAPILGGAGGYGAWQGAQETETREGQTANSPDRTSPE